MRVLLCIFAVVTSSTTSTLAQWSIGFPVGLSSSWLVGTQQCTGNTVSTSLGYVEPFTDSEASSYDIDHSVFVECRIKEWIFVRSQIGLYRSGILHSMSPGIEVPTLVFDSITKVRKGVSAPTEYRLTQTFSLIGAGIVAGIAPYGNLRFLTGITCSYLVSSRQEESYEVVPPKKTSVVPLPIDNHFPGVWYTKPMAVSGTLFWALQLGLTYDIPVEESTYFSPFVVYDRGLTQFSSLVDFRIRTLRAGFTVKKEL